MPFFKRNVQQSTFKLKRQKLEEDVSSESEEDAEDFRKPEESETDEESEETAQEKKVRLAKKYLEEIERQEKEKLEDEFVDDARVKQRLTEDVLALKGQLKRNIADLITLPENENVRILRNGHKLPITSVVVSHHEKYLFSASKEAVIVKWCFSTGKRLTTVGGHKRNKNNDEILHEKCINTLAISSDDKFLGSGCEGNKIIIWCPETMKVLKMFQGHRGPITGLSFRQGTHTLYSCSADRSVKVWNLDEMIYVETLFGHQDSITDIHSLQRERALTAGGRDGSIRLWKIIEESQLVYEGHKGSIDCVRFLNEQSFISGGDDGSLCLWNIAKKKPLFTMREAHGADSSGPNWITSIGCLVNTDLIASASSVIFPGSKNGKICLWKCEGERKLVKMHEIPLVGFINSIQFTQSGDNVVVGVGQEHKRGRWWRIKEAKNSIMIIPLNKKED